MEVCFLLLLVALEMKIIILNSILLGAQMMKWSESYSTLMLAPEKVNNCHLDRPNPILPVPPHAANTLLRQRRVVVEALSFEKCWLFQSCGGRWGFWKCDGGKRRSHNPSVGGACCVCTTPPNRSDGFVVVYRFSQILDCISSFYITLSIPGLLLCTSIQLEDF